MLKKLQDLTEVGVERELTQCTIRYRRLVHAFADGYRVWKIDPPGEGEVWYCGEMVLKLAPELMAVFEDALMRADMREPPDLSWQLVDNDAA